MRACSKSSSQWRSSGYHPSTSYELSLRRAGLAPAAPTYRDRRDVADDHPLRFHLVRHRHCICRSHRSARRRSAGSRALMIRLAAAALLGVLCLQPTLAANPGFTQFLESLWPEAEKRGISRQTFETATRGLEPNLSLPDLVIPGRTEKPGGGQAEFVQAPADYVRESSIANLASHAKKLAAEHRATLSKIEQQFGVPGNVVLAIWGRETDFGRYRLPHSAITVLATQAYLGRRKEQFREEFLTFLKLLQESHVRLDARSSWAGAMGLTQFLPSEFYKHGVDIDGDGRSDIFNSIPDALGSAAKQLLNKGWQPGKRWAYEVHPPKDIDCTIGEPS